MGCKLGLMPCVIWAFEELKLLKKSSALLSANKFIFTNSYHDYSNILKNLPNCWTAGLFLWGRLWAFFAWFWVVEGSFDWIKELIDIGDLICNGETWDIDTESKSNSLAELTVFLWSFCKANSIDGSLSVNVCSFNEEATFGNSSSSLTSRGPNRMIIMKICQNYD